MEEQHTFARGDRVWVDSTAARLIGPPARCHTRPGTVMHRFNGERHYWAVRLDTGEVTVANDSMMSRLD